MSTPVGINGFGRIGRLVFRAAAGKDLDIVGIYPNYAEAEVAWRGKAQATIDSADVRYFVVHMHRLMDPETGHEHGDDD